MMNKKDILEITVCKIHMHPPILSIDNVVKRQSQNKEEQIESLISFEAYLRRTAYKNTTIKTDETFFDDSDMKSEYYLIIVYDKITNTPLLSARHYFDKSVIAKYLKGDNGKENEHSYLDAKFNLDSYSDGKVFLADRLSGNISNSIYRKYRNNIFSYYYSEILNNNKNCTLLLMVRKERHDKQLSKYLNLGFNIIGSSLHKGREHNIILHDLKNV